ncbi:hypothetical protein VKT23_004586 [Stygiomarasmius scandens]|uniref:Zinc-finger domain-containing protein n=1 Tax=Marasmiellus scandens TaxID=2682957 RepID=A0ABR1JUJ3_9AGAR
MNSSSLANWNGSQVDAKQRKPVPSQSSFLASWTVAAASNVTARDGRGFNAARATEDQARHLHVQHPNPSGKEVHRRFISTQAYPPAIHSFPSGSSLEGASSMPPPINISSSSSTVNRNNLVPETAHTSSRVSSSRATFTVENTGARVPGDATGASSGLDSDDVEVTRLLLGDLSSSPGSLRSSGRTPASSSHPPFSTKKVRTPTVFDRQLLNPLTPSTPLSSTFSVAIGFTNLVQTPLREPSSYPESPSIPVHSSLFTPSPTLSAQSVHRSITPAVPLHPRPGPGNSALPATRLSHPRPTLQFQTPLHDDASSRKRVRKALLVSHVQVPPLPADSSRAGYFTPVFMSLEKWTNMTSQGFLRMLGEISPGNTPRSSPNASRALSRRPASGARFSPSKQVYVEIHSQSPATVRSRDPQSPHSPYPSLKRKRKLEKNMFGDVAEALNFANTSAIDRDDEDEGYVDSSARKRRRTQVGADKKTKGATGPSLPSSKSTGSSQSVVSSERPKRDASRSKHDDQDWSHGARRKKKIKSSRVEVAKEREPGTKKRSTESSTGLANSSFASVSLNKVVSKHYSYDSSTDVVTLFVKLPSEESKQGSVLIPRYWDCRDLEQERLQGGILSYPPPSEEVLGRRVRVEKGKLPGKSGRVSKEVIEEDATVHDAEGIEDLQCHSNDDTEPEFQVMQPSAKALGKRRAVDSSLFSDDEEDQEMVDDNVHQTWSLDEYVSSDNLSGTYLHPDNENSIAFSPFLANPHHSNLAYPLKIGINSSRSDPLFSPDSPDPDDFSLQGRTPDTIIEAIDADLVLRSGTSSTEFYAMLGMGTSPTLFPSSDLVTSDQARLNGENSLDVDHSTRQSANASLSSSSPSLSSPPFAHPDTSSGPSSSKGASAELIPRLDTRLVSVQQQQGYSSSLPSQPNSQVASVSNPGSARNALQDLCGYSSSDEEEEKAREEVDMLVTLDTGVGKKEAPKIIDVDADGDADIDIGSDADASGDEEGSTTIEIVDLTENGMDRGEESATATIEDNLQGGDLKEKQADMDTDSDTSDSPARSVPRKRKKSTVPAESASEEPKYTYTENGNNIEWPTVETEYYCHHCRRKVSKVFMTCASCPKRWCIRCLIHRYSDEITFDDAKKDWKCFLCEGTCKCDICCRHRDEIYRRVPFPKVIQPVMIRGQQVVLRTTVSHSRPKSQPKPKPKPKPKSRADSPSFFPLPRRRTLPKVSQSKPSISIAPIVATEVYTEPLHLWGTIYDYSGRPIAQAHVSDPGHLDIETPPHVFVRPPPAPIKPRTPPPQINLSRKKSTRVFVGEFQPEWELEEGHSVKSKNQVAGPSNLAVGHPSPCQRLYVGRPPKKYLPRPLTPETSPLEESQVDTDIGIQSGSRSSNHEGVDIDSRREALSPQAASSLLYPEDNTNSGTTFTVPPTPEAEFSLVMDDAVDYDSPLTDLTDEDASESE